MRSRFHKRSNNSKVRINITLIGKFLLTAILYVGFFILLYNILSNFIKAKNFEKDIVSFASKNSETLFEINEITLYSSANATNNESNNQIWNLDISQFTDISFYVSNPKNKVIKSLTIDDILFTQTPEIGTPIFAYKNPMGFGKLTDFNATSVTEINFDVLDKETENYENPFVYNNLTSPITLTYINKNVKTNYQIRNSQTSIFYDGRLLKTANVDLTKLNSSISFRIIITTLSGEEYQCRVYLSIPLKATDATILDGSILQTISVNNKFYQF